ncbi:MAG: IS256 family transposase [Chloroflexi bacterium]|jgi:transposase-like protein|nr:IS256 family transposase [Chloroflexota bacterium]
MAKREKSALRKLIEEHDVKSIQDVQDLVKTLTSGLIQEVMDAELEDDLGYSKYDYKNKNGTNSRNGSYSKNVTSSQGTIELHIPRDREGIYKPQIVKKHQLDISDIEDKIMFLYSQGTSTRDIERTMAEMYGIEVDASRVSRITDKLLPLIREWQERPLEGIYAHVIMDAIHYKVREEGIVVKKAVYVAIGTDLSGMKDVLGLWIGASEGAKFWLNVLNGLKSRGVRDVLIFSIDGLAGFSEAIGVAFPKAEVQRCVVHQIRNATKYVSYKDLKAFTAGLKPIYKAATESAALLALEELEAVWGDKYPLAVKSWRDNWDELATMFKYPEEIRRMIYTTNAMENFNRQLRKVTKTKGAFVSDDALLKQLYLVTMQITQRWTMPVKLWRDILAQLIIFFQGRVSIPL